MQGKAPVNVMCSCGTYLYTMEYYSAIKRNGTVPFAETWMDLETVIQSEVSQKEENKCRIISFICGI